MSDITPQLILHGGRIRTMDRDGAVASAAAISGDRIIGLGPDRAILAARGPHTRVIDLRGRTVTPGFTDAHCHPVFGGLRRVECSLDRFSTVEDHLAAVAAFAAANPDRLWISGDGWSLDTFPGGIPRRELLDAVVPDRPVFLSNRDGHGAWVNTRALELAGVTAATPDPPHGRIERDPDGTPLGMLQEAAMNLVADHIPPHDAATLERAVVDAQAQYHAWGITGWNDAMVDAPFLAAYRAVAGRGGLTARVVLSLRSADLEGFGGPDGIAAIRDSVAADAAAADPAAPGAARLSAGSVKFFVDGILESRTGAMLEPYLEPDGRPTDNVGFLNFEPAELRRLSIELDIRGLDLHYHAIGDRAVREALDAIEAVRLANGSRDRRPHIAHIQVIHPDDLPRFAALDAVANAQPLWAVHEPQMDELTIPILGPERTAWQYPFGSLLRAGARMAFGSDWTVSTADPFPQIEVAVRRVWPEHRDAEPFLPAERLTLDEALRAATVGSAFVNRQDEAGWLGVGRLADLAVLDHDIDAPDAPPIGDTTVVATIVGGEIVYEAPALGG
ncbi:MAG: amidohydrolase [Chloroflexota bacterium]|nr:MAG: amidohydrolase [Chloroflexota bacterium]